MKRFALLMFLAAIPCFGQCTNTVVGNFTCIQGKECNNSGLSCAFTSSLGAHHLAVVSIGSNDTNISGFTVTGTNTYTCGTVTHGGTQTGREMQMCWVCDSAAGAETVTVHESPSAETYIDINVIEYSGAATTNCKDVEAAGAFGSFSTGNFAVTAGDLIVAKGLTAQTIGAGTGYNTLGSIDGFFMGEYKAESTTTADAVFTGTANSDNIVIATAFKSASGAPSETCTLSLMGAGPC